MEVSHFLLRFHCIVSLWSLASFSPHLKGQVLAVHWSQACSQALHDSRGGMQPLCSRVFVVLPHGWGLHGAWPSASAVKSPVHRQARCVVTEGISCWKDRQKTRCWKETSMPALLWITQKHGTRCAWQGRQPRPCAQHLWRSLDICPE